MLKLQRITLATLLLLVGVLSLPLQAEEFFSRKQRTLAREEIKDYDLPIHEQSAFWLKEQFGPGKKYPINLTRATKNILWQVHEEIRTGKQEPIRGIIRTFWYTHIKPVFARTDSLDPTSDQSEILSEALVELVRDHDLMRYKDFGFIDQNSGNRQLGQNLQILLIGEKHGKYAMLREIAQELDCAVLTLGGQPSLLSMEYLVDEYKKRGFDLRQTIYALFIVDYDPAGWIIRDTVLRDLQFYGMSNVKPIDLVQPNLFTKEELKLIQYPLPQQQKALNEKWIKRTGAVNGQPFGFESDSIPFPKLRQIILDAAKQNIRNKLVLQTTQKTSSK